MGHHDLATTAIEQKLLESESVIARERASQMSLLRELDRRQVALRDGHRSLRNGRPGGWTSLLRPPVSSSPRRGVSKTSPTLTQRWRGCDRFRPGRRRLPPRTP